MKRLAILGASGHGRVVADAASLVGWDEIVFFDDQYPTLSQNAVWPVSGTFERLIEAIGDFDGVLVAIGQCKMRLERHRSLQAIGAPVVSIVHPGAWLSHHAVLGIGGVLMAGAIINMGASLGEACIVNSGATVDHDCRLADAVHVAPGAHLSGNVAVGPRSWIGVGASVKHGITIGADVMVGAGAVVVKDVEDSQTVVGSPARPRANPIETD
jgi:sugar O-acyltransferase (sialic acid O-acetyltransferase NeuD family)